MIMQVLRQEVEEIEAIRQAMAALVGLRQDESPSERATSPLQTQQAAVDGTSNEAWPYYGTAMWEADSEAVAAATMDALKTADDVTHMHRQARQRTELSLQRGRIEGKTSLVSLVLADRWSA